jgi:hypothetical protein
MRHIEKGGSPDILTNDGATFQREALEFATGIGDGGDFAEDLKKFAVYNEGDDEDESFHHYASGLFAKRSYYSDPDVKQKLIASHNGKCGFCESFIMATDVGDVEHYRPKAEVTGPAPDNKMQEISLDGHSGYFWLAASWDNLYLSCKQCNQAYKRNLFDLLPDSPRMTFDDLDAIEAPLLLHPGLPEDQLRRLIRYDPSDGMAILNPNDKYGSVVDLVKESPRIQRTIEIVGLNRPRLLEARAHHLVKLRSLFVLAAAAAMPISHALPAKSDPRPAILDFLAPIDSAAADAIAALEHAIQPSAEFSALALDALITWSAELAFGELPAQVGLEDVSSIRLVTSRPRLQPQVVLAEKIRTQNAASSAAEAAAGLDDLDEQYGTLLGKYKSAMKALAPQKAKLEAASKKVISLSEARDRAREDGTLATYEDTALEVEAMERQISLGLGQGKIEEHPKYKDLQALKETLRKMELSIPNLQNLVAADDNLVAKIKATEAPAERHLATLTDISEDLVDVAEGYIVRKVPSALKRQARCQQFRAALDNALGWLSDNDELSGDVKQHLKGRGFPAAIRK